jgi:hypothetical protein
MLGNDVIDLADPETSSRHPRFDARVFGATERALIARSEDAERLRQVLWAAKEAAYKAARSSAPETIFSPRRFAVSLGADGTGRVAFPGGEAVLRVRSDGDCVHVVATLAGIDAGRVVWAEGRVAEPADPAAPSRAVRALATSDIAARLGTADAGLRVERRRRAPSLRGSDACAALSLSHHGRFVAYAALLDIPSGATH